MCLTIAATVGPAACGSPTAGEPAFINLAATYRGTAFDGSPGPVTLFHVIGSAGDTTGRYELLETRFELLDDFADPAAWDLAQFDAVGWAMPPLESDTVHLTGHHLYRATEDSLFLRNLPSAGGTTWARAAWIGEREAVDLLQVLGGEHVRVRYARDEAGTGPFPVVHRTPAP